ncbi:hypothetical protein [Marinobacter antarcticus]|nr:hypothetical protein [Marinobacter antarcticus]
MPLAVANPDFHASVPFLAACASGHAYRHEVTVAGVVDIRDIEIRESLAH